MKRTIHLESVGLNKAPKGLWIRLCTDDRLLTEYALEDAATAGKSGTEDGRLAGAAIAAGETVYLYFYDGRSGVCYKTIITKGRTE